MPISPLRRRALRSTALAVAYFILQNVRRWAKEAREQRLAASGYSSDWS